MFNLFGAVCVVLSASMIGLVFRRRMALRVQMLQSLLSGFSMLRTQIVFLQTPLGQAAAEIAHTTNNAVFAVFAEALHNGQTPAEAMRDATLPLEHADARLLMTASNGLGGSDAASQSRLIDALCNRLSAQITAAEQTLATHGRLCMSAGVLCGLLLVILLL